jgi:4-hydroxyphenylpyruvate dioxygenase
MQAKKESLGIRGWDTFEFIVHDLERSQQFYTESFGLPLIGQATENYRKNHGEDLRLFGRAGITMACVAPTEKGGRADRWLQRHPDGIAVLAFRVRDLAHTHRVLAERGATFCTQIQTKQDILGQPFAFFEIATPLGDVRYRFVERTHEAWLPDIQPLEQPQGLSQAFQSIDHVTSNMLTLEPYISWLQDVMGFEQYWQVQFHTSDVNGESGSGLASTVMWDPESKLKMANNEPLLPNFEASQIYSFVEDNRGPGVQHIAFHVPDIQTTVDSLLQKGLHFLDVPATYYEMLPARLKEHHVTNFSEDMAALQKLGVLVDGDDDKYLLQLFMQEGATLFQEKQAGPFFYEIIQRKGATLFGEGNFRALFESIERDQIQRQGA